MSSKNLKTPDNMNFDALIASSLPDLPPEEITKDVTPWKKSMNRAIAGLAMTAVSFNFLGLNYILPAIGMTMRLTGFRALRNENKWLRGCWILSVCKILCFIPSMLIQTTIFSQRFAESILYSVISNGNGIISFITIVCLWRGFIDVKKKAGLRPEARSAAILVIWYIAIIFLALLQYSGFAIGWLMIISYFFIIYRLFKLPAELDEAGYVIKPAPARISDRTVTRIIFSVLIAGAACGYIFFGRYPMDWQPYDSSAHAEPKTAEISRQLDDLGFPEEILADLSAEDILACEGATDVCVHKEEMSVDNGVAVEVPLGRTTVIEISHDLHVNHIIVRLPDKDNQEQWKVFYHFRWNNPMGHRGMEAIRHCSVYRYDEFGWSPYGEITGHVLFDTGTGTMVSPYCSLASQTYRYEISMLGQDASDDIFAEFSFPSEGENQRGYISYNVVAVDETHMLRAFTHYMYQKKRVQFPVMTAMEALGGSYSYNIYRMLQSDINHIK